MSATVYLFFTTMPPPRVQNISLLVSDKDLTDQEAQRIVQQHNKGISIRARVTGVIFSVCFLIAPPPPPQQQHHLIIILLTIAEEGFRRVLAYLD